MTWRTLALVALGCTVASLGGRDAHGVPADVRLSQLTRREYSVDSGLPQASILTMAQATDRSLWVGTAGGLVRFDGASFIPVAPAQAPTLATRGVRALLRDRAGTVWIATGNQLMRVRGGAVEVLPGAPMRGPNTVIEDRSGTVWVSASSGVFRVRAGAVEHVRDSPAPTWSLWQDADGAVWGGQVAPGVHRVREDRFERVELPASLAAHGVRALHGDGDVVWLGSDGGGLARWRRGVERVWTRADGLPDDHVTALLRDRAGTLWIGTQRGLARLVDGGLRTFPVGDDLASEPIESLLEDDEDGLWVGTRSAGLMRLSRGRLFAYDEAEGLPSRRIISVAGGSERDLFIGTRGDGLVRLIDGRPSRITTRDGLCTDELWALLVTRAGVLWAGGPLAPTHGLCRLRNGAWEPILLPAERRGRPFAPRMLLEARDGTIWVGADRLYRARGTELEAVGAPDDLPGDSVQTLAEGPSGELWVGGTQRLRRLHDGRWEAFPPSEGGPPAPVLSFHVDSAARTWIGTAEGLVVHRNDRFFRFVAAHGLDEDPVFAIEEDAEGALWVGTPRGLFSVPSAALVAVADGHAARVHPVRYGRADGMKSDQIDGTSGHGLSFRDRTGRLWFPAVRSLVAVEPRAATGPQVASPHVIDAVVADGHLWSMPAGVLTIPPGERTLELRYSRVSLAAADKLRFRYRLQGIDHAWIEAGARRVAYYTKLPPGRYRFEVAADLPDAPPVDAATLDIVLSPYFRETGASRALLIAVLAAAAFAIHRVRLGRLAGRHRAVLAERARIARDLHDTLAQGFTGIALHLEAANKRLDAQPERARESLERAKALANSSLVEARRAVWDLREEPRHDGGLLAALADTARTLGAEVPVRLQIRGKPAPLSPRTTEVLTRVGQESVTNALKHAGARELRFTLAFDDARVELRIEDDGRGFDVNAPPVAGHMGLASMRARVEELGGTLVIESVDGSGTSVSVVLPTGDP